MSIHAQEVTLFEIYIDTFMHIPQKNITDGNIKMSKKRQKST